MDINGRLKKKFLGKMMKEGRKKIEFLEKLEKATRINRNDYFVINIACESYVSSDLNCSLSGYRCIRCNS